MDITEELKYDEIYSYLKAYCEDLKYQLDHPSFGIGFMNSASSGTPCFETREQAQKYVRALDLAIQNYVLSVSDEEDDQ